MGKVIISKLDLKKLVIELIKSFLLGIIFVLIITRFFLPSMIIGTSMNPTFADNDYILINKTSYRENIPNRGELIIFKSDIEEKALLKRVVGVEGDTISVDGGILYLNNKKVKEDYITLKDRYIYNDLFNDYEKTDDFNVNSEIIEIPRGKIFVLGDNRFNSIDSRDPEIGLVNIEDIVGKVFLRIYPIHRFKIF